jgi:ABC-type phosphate/phosphonate transport system substrate-binding protein
MTTLRLSYYPDITQHRTPQEIRDAVIVFASALERELQRSTGAPVSINVLPVMSVPDQTRATAEGECEIALIKPSAYIYAHRRNAKVLPAAVALRKIDGKIGDTYFAQVYAQTRLGLRTFDDLRAACRQERSKRPTVGFGDSFSTANFLVPAALLVSNGCNPFTRFRRMEFFGGHDGTARAVYEDKADVGAGHDGVIVDLARQPGYADAEARLTRIGRRDIHSDPVAVVVDDGNLRSAIEQSLLAIEALDPVKKALDVFWGAVFGLGPTKHANYKSIEDAIDSLGIPEADVLGV